MRQAIVILTLVSTAHACIPSFGSDFCPSHSILFFVLRIRARSSFFLYLFHPAFGREGSARRIASSFTVLSSALLAPASCIPQAFPNLGAIARAVS
ncbi:hypothetical protein DFP72DRAFT_941361 [Ephemerocybe angulata]|uniref:Secreted protein n=1 Tax=Ephemerocybe angulata TaxID=980116 RepID=A0A8H6H932_9AGAR|nr:hypothetical protein DFP72DRAFT_941361 [Tulosesus angulatus]